MKHPAKYSSRASIAPEQKLYPNEPFPNQNKTKKTHPLTAVVALPTPALRIVDRSNIDFLMVAFSDDVTKNTDDV